MGTVPAGRFVQIHALVSYPPGNPNRDDLGRPKTAVFGGTTRQRISSQALKRAWRLGKPMQDLDTLSTRTRQLGRRIVDQLIGLGVPERQALEWAAMIAGEFGQVKKGELETGEVVVLGPEELAAVDELAARLAKEGRKPSEEELKSLERPTRALDVAMFGRMRADRRDVNVDAAVQVAHAITTNAVRVESDYWTAVDDLNLASESGAGGIGEREFGSGVYYLYVCVDVPALLVNLGDDAATAAKGLEALIRSVAAIGPSGHRNSFANRAYAQYLRAEMGSAQPRSLVGAFENAVEGRRRGLMPESIEALEAHAADMDRAYGQCYEKAVLMDVPGRRGTLDEVLAAVSAG